MNEISSKKEKKPYCEGVREPTSATVLGTRRLEKVPLGGGCNAEILVPPRNGGVSGNSVFRHTSEKICVFRRDFVFVFFFFVIFVTLIYFGCATFVEIVHVRVD